MSNNTRVNNMTFTRKPAMEKIERILQACKHGRTRQELEIILGLTRRTTLSYLIHLHDAEQIHIGSWKREGLGQFYPVPVYKTGHGQDAPRPGPLTEREKHQRAWAKLKADPERYARHRAKKSRQAQPQPAANDSPFNWRGQPSIITSSDSWKKSVAATKSSAGSGNDPRKQFIIKRTA